MNKYTLADLSYTVFVESSKSPKNWQVTAWCEKNFGPRWNGIANKQGTWCCLWQGIRRPRGYKWYFRNERDALFFILTWKR